MLVQSKQVATIPIPSPLKNLKISCKQCIPSTSGRTGIFVVMLWVAKLKCYPFFKGTQIIREKNNSQDCAVTTRKSTLFAILPALV